MPSITSAKEFMDADLMTREIIKQNATQSMTLTEREYLSMLFECGIEYYENTLQMLWHWNTEDETRQ